MKGQTMPGKLTKIVLLAAVAVLAGLSSPASANPRGYIEGQEEVGYFYGTFGQSPNIALLVGGRAEEFCEGDPGTAPSRVFLRSDGSVDIKVRVSVLSESLVDVSNSVNGKATGIDGTEYEVRGWADLIVENGVPVGDPEDFVGFELKEIRR